MPTRKQILVSMNILLLGTILASIADKPIDKASVMVLVIFLACHILGIFDRLKQSLQHIRFLAGWKIPYTVMAVTVFAMLAGVSIYMLRDALKNGVYWWTDYRELQYGSFQIYDVVEEYHREHPDARMIFSPIWANGADVLNRFFLGTPPWLDSGSIEGYTLQKFPMDENTVFIMTPTELDVANQSEKLTDIRVEKTVPYPDGTPAFHFVHLQYVDNIDEIFAAERAARAVLQEGVVTIDGQEVAIRHSYLDALDQPKAIQLLFDENPLTYSKTFEDNPFIIELTFPTTREISGFSIIIGSANIQITWKGYSILDGESVTYTFEGKGSMDEPMLSFDFPEPTQVQFLHLEVLDPHAPPPAQIHIWELDLQFNDS
jgi:hypothetical protein